MRTVGVVLAAVIAAGCFVIAAPGATGDEGDLARARERANAAAAELSRAETRAGELELQVAEQQRQLDAAQTAVAGLRATLRVTAVAAYIGAAGDPAAQFISGEDLNRSVQTQALASLVTQNNADAVDQYRVAAEDAEAARANLDSTLGEQRDVVESLRDRRAELDAELSRLEELERQRREAEERRRAAEAAAAAARNARSQRSSRSGNTAGNTVSSAPTAPIASGDWICPVQGAVAFVDSWGDARSGGRRHQGVDMMAAHGHAGRRTRRWVGEPPWQLGRRHVVLPDRRRRQLLLRHPSVGLRQPGAASPPARSSATSATPATRGATRTCTSRSTPVAARRSTRTPPCAPTARPNSSVSVAENETLTLENG